MEGKVDWGGKQRVGKIIDSSESKGKEKPVTEL